MLTFTNDELLELLRNRAQFNDRIAARAAERLEKALGILAGVATEVSPSRNTEIHELLNVNN